MTATAAALASKITEGPDGTVYGPNGTPAGKARGRGKATGKAKTAKAKPAAKRTGSGPATGERGVLVAKALSKHSGGTLQDVVKWTKLDERAAYHHLWHLRKEGFVKSGVADEVGVLFELTAKGQKLAKS